MRRSNSCLTLGCAAGRLRSAAASCSRPPTKRGPSAYEAACLDGARGNSVPTSFLSADISTNTSGSATPHIKAGTVRALAVSTAKRSSAFPDLPTLAEAGLTGYDVTTWYGLLTPKGTPAAIRERLAIIASEGRTLEKQLRDLRAAEAALIQTLRVFDPDADRRLVN